MLFEEMRWDGWAQQPTHPRRCVRANCPRGRRSPSDFRRPSAMAERDCSKHLHVKLG